ncbi:hypothetical protein EJB05_13362, partial [Eragrostis curvula]
MFLYVPQQLFSQPQPNQAICVVDKFSEETCDLCQALTGTKLFSCTQITQMFATDVGNLTNILGNKKVPEALTDKQLKNGQHCFCASYEERYTANFYSNSVPNFEKFQ